VPDFEALIDPELGDDFAIMPWAEFEAMIELCARVK